ncbi:MAG: HNH endonuclease family protein [Armatimonadota bacterium]
MSRDITSIPDDILCVLRAVTAKRPKVVIEHIIDHGYITTEELKTLYGYNHPPRAARDVREQGIPLETFRIKDSTGRQIGAYRFTAWEDFRKDILKGRYTFSKQFKQTLVGALGSKCNICFTNYDERYLQIDHNVPYEISGDDASLDRKLDEYMLLCSSCNRAKSWSCEQCNNWKQGHDHNVCLTCYWASPLDYLHIATFDMRRLELVWSGEETSDFDEVSKIASDGGIDLIAYVKAVLKKSIGK